MDRYKDKHHLLHTEKHWNSMEQSARLRSMGSLIFRLTRDVHEDLHRNAPPVPLLGYHAVVRTLKMYEAGDTPLESVANLQKAIEHAANHPKAHIVEKHLAELAIWAIDEQKPYIAQSPDQPPLATVIDLAAYRQLKGGGNGAA